MQLDMYCYQCNRTCFLICSKAVSVIRNRFCLVPDIIIDLSDAISVLKCKQTAAPDIGIIKPA